MLSGLVRFYALDIMWTIAIQEELSMLHLELIAQSDVD